MAQQHNDAATFTGLIDLASEKIGGQALIASDEFFAEKENLLKPGRGIFIPDKYTERGKWMDGWESRRKRVPGYDWCIVKLGVAGVVSAMDIDTNHFLGNYPPYASVEACYTTEDLSTEQLAQSTEWQTILPQSPLKPGSQNLFVVAERKKYSHIRLNIFPDGGVARLRIYGNVAIDYAALTGDTVIDLAGIQNGAEVMCCSDMFFSPKENLIMPLPPVNMGDGWETRRKRPVPGHDWSIVRLGTPGVLQKIEVNTHFFKGNYPDSCSLEGCFAPHATITDLQQTQWQSIVHQSKLQADHSHVYENLTNQGPFTHVRLNIFPDGGISRMRVYGKPVQAGEV